MKLSILLIFCFLHTFSFAQVKAGLEKEIDAYMQTVALKDGFTGTIAVSHHGKIIIQKGYGLADRKKLLQNSAETIHNLGSAGSIFTEMSVLMLVEQRKLLLSDPICKYLKGCPAGWKLITIRHLLEQTSGLRDYLLKPGIEDQLSNYRTRKNMLDGFASDTLQFLPGTKFNSSATGYYLLGLIIEKVSGRTLSSFIHKNIFDPLKMNRAKLLEKDEPISSTVGYIIKGDSILPAPVVHPSLMYGYGNLYGSATDILRWEASLYGNQLLSPASLQLRDDWIALAGFGERENKLYGHAFQRYYKGTWGHRMHMLRFPGDSTVILILTNNNSTRQDKFMRDIASMIYSSYVPPKEIKEVYVDSVILNRYVGVYSFAPGRDVAITIENGKLHMQGTHRPRRELVAVSNSKFYIKGSEVYLEFKEAGDLITQLVLHEINATITAERK